MNPEKPPSSKNQFQRFLAICLASTTLSPSLVLPAFAEGTPAGTVITNEATADYQDDDGNDFDTQSNTVQVTVAKIAGITNRHLGVNDLDGGSVEANDELQFDFLITNTGNAPTNIFIPGANQITTTGFSSIDRVEILFDTDGDGEYDDASEEVTDQDNGLIVDGIDTDTNGVPADADFVVRVTGTVADDNALGDPISVTLGNTGLNDNSPATQNQPDDSDNSLDDEVRTVNIGDEPANGEREASSTKSVEFTTQIEPLAFATIRKVASNVDSGATSSGSDDIITYDLGLTVESSSLDGSFEAAPLEGTTIRLDGLDAERVLISDAIPEGTVLTPTEDLDNDGTIELNGEDLPDTVTDSEGNEWTVVYSFDDPTTTVPVDPDPDDVGVVGLPAAEWTQTAPNNDDGDDTNDFEDVERIGFIYDATTNGNELPANGAELTGFQFSVLTSGLPGAGGSVFNLAQVFGQTFDDPNDTIDVDNEIIYDESGDQRPNNFNDDGTPPDDTGSAFDPGEDTGVANPNEDGIDENNNNTGQGPDGENNEVIITGTVVSEDRLLNGPLNEPGAIGPNNDNDDFTNVSIGPDPDNDGTNDPNSVTIENTVGIRADASRSDNVTIEPIVPTGGTSAESASETPGSGFFGANGDIPDGTTVTIRFDVDGDGTAETATYTYDATNEEFTTNDAPINVGSIEPGEEITYEVDVDLPSGTNPVAGYNIPIIAFPDDDPTNSPGFTGETVNNITIDRVYTGFITLVKEARILNPDGTVKEGFTDNPSQQAEPGDFIEYRIRYENISEAPIGSGNVTLNANNFIITEDGTVADSDGDRIADQNGNNWALDGSDNGTPTDTDDTDNGVIDTLHSQNTDASDGTVTFSNLSGPIGTTDPADGTDVTQYENEVGTVEPGDTGIFTFRREVQ